MNKKLVCFILIIINIICFCSCSKDGNPSNENSSEIILTTSNFEKYVNLSCRATGASSTYKDGKYSGMMGYATCTGIQGYYYDNVYVEITIYFNDGTNDASPTIKLYLNVGGNASGSQYYTILNTKYNVLAYVSASTISAYSWYSIEYVRGSVRRF